ncbi:hypothetical protein BD310DRAFT_701259 [Dichomitus squalens]|uniref:Uncharacterized protein n=1 Tax=Dichomitus squalens TaxID=114155 RepID=A0A4Q9Q629_9APHY|nr:hypothetical protein BD310DRAFT_701259 [Dichomitus squalens]
MLWNDYMQNDDAPAVWRRSEGTGQISRAPCVCYVEKEAIPASKMVAYVYTPLPYAHAVHRTGTRKQQLEGFSASAQRSVTTCFVSAHHLPCVAHLALRSVNFSSHLVVFIAQVALAHLQSQLTPRAIAPVTGSARYTTTARTQYATPDSVCAYTQ